MTYIVKKSSVHGKGVFASEDFDAGELIGNFEVEYAHVETEYTYYYHDIKVNVINELKYANHSDDPNSVMIGFDLYASKPIKKGEEILWYYGEEWCI